MCPMNLGLLPEGHREGTTGRNLKKCTQIDYPTRSKLLEKSKQSKLFFVLLASILLPIVALGIASIFAIPYHFVKRWLNSHALIQLIIYVVLMAVAFTFYSFFLKVIKDLMESGKISFIFNESNVKAIGTFCSIVYPANIVAKLMIGEKIFINILLLLAGTVVGGVICFFINKRI